jgi:transposase
MPRSLKIRKLHISEIRQLHELLEQDFSTRQRRRGEVLLLYSAGMEALTIAQALGSHVNTIYSDLQAFERDGVECIRQRLYGGAPVRITEVQRATILDLAETPPSEVGLPYGRWSLSKLREYLLKHRVVEAISREHLRRVLKKGGSAFAMLRAN